MREGVSLCWLLFAWLEVLLAARRGGKGRKLQLELGRLETSVKISEINLLD